MTTGENTMTISDAKTVGQIARDLGEPEHRVKHVVNSRRIEPLGRVGIIRLYGPAAVDRVRQALRDIDARRHSLSRNP